jgi:predicted metal-dependent HD superfamily phosphohydrolase
MRIEIEKAGGGVPPYTLRRDGGAVMGDDWKRNRFIRLWQELARKLGVGDEHGSAVGRVLLEAYTGEDRHYHGVRHILGMLEGIEFFEFYGPRFHDPDAARLAAFFHDVVYLPGRNDNESRSAEQMSSSLLTEVANVQVVRRAGKMITATSEHRMTGDSSVDLFIDLDMSVLGSSWPEYSWYADGVMREYVPVFGEETYRKGRVDLFLEPILVRGTVFVTELYAPFDAGALKNLAREREILASGGRFDVL